jgi:phage terminase large subunit-like protein
VRKLAEKPKIGRPPKTDAEKHRRGTFRPSRSARLRPVKATETLRRRRNIDYLKLAETYAHQVRTGRMVACHWVRLACLRQERDLQRAKDRRWPYVWSPEQAIAACQFIERLPHVEGRWSSRTLELEPWQVFLVTCLFGWRHRSDLARRRFTTVYLEVGRKAAKSTLMAAFSLYHLLEEREPGASVICGATTGQQARIVFSVMQRMVWQSAWLRKRGLEALANAIVSADGTARPINAKASTQDGLNPSCIVLDESHAQTFSLHDVLKSAQGARQNPLLLCPTTAGYDLLSVGYALRTSLTKVLEQVLEAEHFLGLIYTLDEGDDWRDEAVWRKANPMIGVTPSLDWVRRYCTDAQMTPGLEGEFQVKVCSRWLQSARGLFNMTEWAQGADPTLKLEDFAGQRCWIGADLAQLDDLTAVALVFEQGEDLVAFVRCYLPAAVVAERARAVPAYAGWASSGILTLTEGTMIDYDRIEQDLRAWTKQFDVQRITLEKFGAPQLYQRLEAEGLPMVLVQKTKPACTPPVQQLLTRLRRGRFHHDGNSCLTWMASNTVNGARDGEWLLPQKEMAESPNKIDGIDALIWAIDGHERQAAPAPAPRYQMLVL